MSDLTERARKSTGIEKFIASDGLPGFRPHTKLINELADEIERLEAEVVSAEITNENLRAVIRTWPVGAWGWREAQKAIGEDPEDQTNE